jgi:hypothetical protein
MSEIVETIGEVRNDSSTTSFMYLLMNAIERAIEATTKMQVASATTTSQASEAFSSMMKEDNKALEAQAKKVSEAADDDDDNEVTKQQVLYSQMQQEVSAKETIMTGALDVTQQTTTQYSQTLQQHVQIGGVVAQIAGSVAHMLERGYN